jgi:hypothetical protein
VCHLLLRITSNLIKSHDFVKQKLQDHKTLGKIKSSEFPIAAISKTVYPYLLNDVANDAKVIDCDKYEFWLYQQLSYNCSAGHLFIIILS